MSDPSVSEHKPIFYTLAPAIRFANERHYDQPYGVAPYIVHLMLVARHFTDPHRQTIAILHDIVEDTETTLDEIEERFGQEVAQAVDALTRRNGELYLDDYIRRVKKNPTAKEVKIADLKENLFSARYCYPGRYDELVPRYEKALEILGVLMV